MGERDSLLRLPNVDGPCLAWDTFCDLLDGVSWDAIEPRLALSGQGSRSSDDLGILREQLTGPGEYFFEMHPQKRPIETLCIKLALLNQLCVLVAGEHERTRRSHGVISPERVLVQVPAQRTSMLPVCWRAQVSLVVNNQEGTTSFENMPAEMACSLALLPGLGSSVYAAPLVREWPLGRKMSVTALVQSADPIPDDDQANVKGLVRVHVIADDLHARDFSDRDVFRVSLPISRSQGACVELWARKVEGAERGIIMSGMTDAMSLDSWKLFTRTVGDVRSSAEIAVYRVASPAHDVYSCGMLLMRALLGSDERRWSRACELVPSIAEGLEPVVQGIAEDDHYTLHLRVRDRLRESADSFEAEHIPVAIWWDALVAVLRACSRIQGFSYADDATSYEPSPARLLARDVASLARRTRIELFEAGERDAMILRVCDRAMDHLGAGV
jgi:hypothetical protein